jgi:hypothetical protein
VHKVHRFIFPFYIGISLCVGLVLGALANFGRQHSQPWPSRIFRSAPVCLVLAFAAANYPSTEYFHKLLRQSLADLRRACGDLKAMAPDGARIYIAAGSEPYYRLFQYPRHYQLKYFADERQETVSDGWGVVGGFLGIGVSPETVVEQYPAWLRPYYLGQVVPPPGWRLVHMRPSLPDPSTPLIRILGLPAAAVKPTHD